MAKSKYSYVKDFEILEKCLPNCWIVVRIDGRGYAKFAEKYKFKKPNDSRSLHLMSLSAKKVMKDFSEIVLAYGQSDEFSFLFRKDTTLFNRRPQKFASIVASMFTGYFVLNWHSFFPADSLFTPPAFDGRVVILPTERNVKDYFAWRQVDTHVNNLYNTCFWNLIMKKKLTPSEAELELKGTVSSEKHEIMYSKLGMNYNNEPEEFKRGSTIIRGRHKKLDTLFVDIIKDQFWDEHKYILEPSAIISETPTLEESIGDVKEES